MITLITTSVKDLPEGSILQLYCVTDSAEGAPGINTVEWKEYYVQIGYVETGHRDSEGTRSRGVAFSCCTCPEGFLNLPLTLCGRRPRCCQHVDAVIEKISKEDLNGLAQSSIT